MDILSLMIAIPECFKPTKDLYGNHDKWRRKDTELILRGLVAFSGDHYVCYTRAIKTKIDYLGIESEKDYDRINREASEETEWTLFNDNQIIHITGNWKQIVEDCVSARHQPTALLYEKFSHEDQTCFLKAAPPDPRLFQFDEFKIQQLMIEAQNADNDAGIFDDDEIERQKEMFKQFQKEKPEEQKTVQPQEKESK